LVRPFYKTIWRKVGEATGDYHMISDGDKIAVGISGGKDSLLLTWVLAGLREFAPIKFDLVGVTINTGGDMDFSGVSAFCEQLNVPYTIVPTDIWKIVFDIRKEENPCALCAHLRRGALNAFAVDSGCNKVALAHHLDDAIETLLMSMFFEGRIQSFLPYTRLTRSNLDVIRPLLYVQEKDIQKASQKLELPVVPTPCPASGQTKRAEAKDLITSLSTTTPLLRTRLLSCLRSLWDTDVSSRQIAPSSSSTASIL
jgi:tRNA 2-thiocytidine biosynthesis protein TtcA